MRWGCLEEDDCTLCCCCRGLISEIGEDHWRRLELYCRASGIPVEVEFWNSLAWRSIQECKDFGLQEWQNFKIPWISAMKQRIPDGIPQVPDSRRKVTCPKESMDYRFLDCSLFSFCAHFFRPSRLNSLCGYCSIWCWGYKAPCSHLVHAFSNCWNAVFRLCSHKPENLFSLFMYYLIWFNFNLAKWSEFEQQSIF